MDTTVNEILTFVSENEVKFIRLSFCDLFGIHKNIAIMADELKMAFKEGVSFDASSINGFLDVNKSDLFLFPDPTTLTLLPWRPESGSVIRFYCDIKNSDGTPFVCDARNILKQAVKRLENKGYTAKIGVECEFYLFKTDENGEPTQIPIDKGGYFDISPLDKGQDIRREICISLEEMGLQPEASHHERGHGQNEIDFRFSDPISTADNVLTFKSVVKSIAERNGLFASFMPKPLLEQSGSGVHINISLYKDGENLFAKDDKDIADSFIQGVLHNIADMTMFLNSVPNSYKRLGMCEAPKYISWSKENRSQLIRIPAVPVNNRNKMRMEIRSADAALNPYIALALILQAGIDGIENNMKLVPPVNENLYTADESITKNLMQIPKDLKSAIDLAENSEFINRHIDEDIMKKYIEYKNEEQSRFELITNNSADTLDSLDLEVYFPIL